MTTSRADMDDAAPPAAAGETPAAARKTPRPFVAVLDYAIGNLRSAQKGLERAGARAVLTAEEGVIAEADALVLPGVGAFGPCMDAMDASGLSGLAQEAVEAGTPFLAICVGMQLLYEGSEESPGRAGLGVMPGVVKRLPDGVKRPQMQWNRLRVLRQSRLLADLEEEWMYFVHSYAVPHSDYVTAACDYGEALPAVVERGSLAATQFHPEKSSAAGMRLLSNFVDSLS